MLKRSSRETRAAAHSQSVRPLIYFESNESSRRPRRTTAGATRHSAGNVRAQKRLPHGTQRQPWGCRQPVGGRGSWQLDYNSPSTKSFLPKTMRHYGRPFHPTMRARLEICAASLIHSLGGRLCRWLLPHTPPLGPKTHEGITFRTCSKQSIILCLLAVIIGIVHASSAYYGHNINACERLVGSELRTNDQKKQIHG